MPPLHLSVPPAVYGFMVIRPDVDRRLLQSVSCNSPKEIPVLAVFQARAASLVPALKSRSVVAAGMQVIWSERS